jgi:hypothetical protein
MQVLMTDMWSQDAFGFFQHLESSGGMQWTSKQAERSVKIVSCKPMPILGQGCKPKQILV